MKLNNRGVSLVEVVVYMVVSIFIIGYLFNTMTNITKSFSSEKEKTNLQMSGQDAISMLSREIATTGFKHYLDTVTVDGRTSFTLRTIPGTYLRSFGKPNTTPGLDTQDEYEASIIAESEDDTVGYSDELTIFRAKMQGAHDVDAVEKIRYYRSESSNELKRTRSEFPVDGTHHNQWEEKETITLASDVRALKFFYSEDYVTWDNTPEYPQLVNYIQIKILIESNNEGNIINRPSFELGETSDGDKITFTPGPDNKHIYRLYERIVEVPSNGRI